MLTSINFPNPWVVTEQLNFLNPEAALTLKSNSFRVEFERSPECGGINRNIQFGAARRSIITEEGGLVDFSLTGAIQNDFSAGSSRGFEVFVNGVLVLFTSNRELNTRCLMGPPVINILVPGPYILNPGSNDIFVKFDSLSNTFNGPGYFYQLDLTVTRTPPVTDGE